MPKEVPREHKMQHLKEVKLNKVTNKYNALSEKDRAFFIKCSHCTWLREIDYVGLKIYCSLPKCQKDFKERDD